MLHAHKTLGPRISADGTISVEAPVSTPHTLLELGVLRKMPPPEERDTKEFTPVRF